MQTRANPNRRARALVASCLMLALTAVPGSLAARTPVAANVLVWGRTAADAVAFVERVGEKPSAVLPIIGGVSAILDPGEQAQARAAGFTVTPDLAMAVAGTDLDTSAADVQLEAMNPGGDWSLEAGAGVGVALIDTGVTEVADLAGRVVFGPDLSGEGNSRDSYGHGTFMAGLIAGDGASSASGPVRHVGVAPSAHIVSVKVAGADGLTSLSRVLDGIGWAVANGDAHSIRVMNLSVAVPPLSKSYQADPLSAAVEAAWASGITVVAASGNDGSEVSSPGRDPWIITAGALDTAGTVSAADDTVPSWSGRVKSQFGTKPDVLAPGVSVYSLVAPDSTIARENPASITADGNYMRGSGTSMATAMTAGAVAVLTEHHAAATPDDYKAALVRSGREVRGEIGRSIDLAAADLTDVGADESSWQRQGIAFQGLGLGLSERMPWAEQWAGTRWAGTRWAGTRWAGTRWAEEVWAGTRWAGTRWAGTRWAGTRWAGTRWADEVWTGTRWAGTRWAGTRWASDVWTGTRWAGTRWAGTRWAGTRWASQSWTGSST